MKFHKMCGIQFQCSVNRLVASERLRAKHSGLISAMTLELRDIVRDHKVLGTVGLNKTLSLSVNWMTCIDDARGSFGPVAKAVVQSTLRVRM